MVIRGIGHASFSDADFLFGKLVPKTVLSVKPLPCRKSPRDHLLDCHRKSRQTLPCPCLDPLVNEPGLEYICRSCNFLLVNSEIISPAILLLQPNPYLCA